MSSVPMKPLLSKRGEERCEQGSGETRVKEDRNGYVGR